MTMGCPFGHLQMTSAEQRPLRPTHSRAWGRRSPVFLLTTVDVSVSSVETGYCSDLPLLIFEKLTDGESCVFYDPTQQEWRDVSARVEGDGGTSSVRMTELLVRPAVWTSAKPRCFKIATTSRGLSTGAFAMIQGSEIR